jgi:hypothetical protein
MRTGPAQTGAGHGGTTGRDEQVGDFVLVDEKLMTMPLGNDGRIAGRHEDKGDAELHQDVGDGEARLRAEKDVQTDDIDGLAPQDF